MRAKGFERHRPRIHIRKAGYRRRGEPVHKHGKAVYEISWRNFGRPSGPILLHWESLSAYVPFLLKERDLLRLRFQIALLGVPEDEVQSNQPRSDVLQFVLL